MKTRKFGVLFTLMLAAASFTACKGGDGTPGPATPLVAPPDTSNVDPQNPPVDDPVYSVDAMIFNGSGVSTSDWQSTEQIVKSMGLSYRLVNTAQLNAMSLDEIADHGVMIVPGGSGGTIYKNLTEATRLNVRKAVRDRGMGYVGFCAGAWVAVGPEADTDNTASYGMAVAEGAVLPYWYPPGNEYARTDMVYVTFSDGTQRSLVWYGGPATPEWTNGVVARYSTGDPAISQTASGKGYVVISGPHPEAPQGWRAEAGPDPDGLDFDITIDMINAALKKRPLPVY